MFHWLCSPNSPRFTVNLRQVDSVMTGMDSSAPVLTLVRTVANTTDAVKFVSMDPNAAEEWKVAINENRFNCKQILDLSEPNQARDVSAGGVALGCRECNRARHFFMGLIVTLRTSCKR